MPWTETSVIVLRVRNTFPLGDSGALAAKERAVVLRPTERRNILLHRRSNRRRPLCRHVNNCILHYISHPLTDKVLLKTYHAKRPRYVVTVESSNVHGNGNTWPLSPTPVYRGLRLGGPSISLYLYLHLWCPEEGAVGWKKTNKQNPLSPCFERTLLFRL